MSAQTARSLPAAFSSVRTRSSGAKRELRTAWFTDCTCTCPTARSCGNDDDDDGAGAGTGAGAGVGAGAGAGGGGGDRAVLASRTQSVTGDFPPYSTIPASAASCI